MMQALVADSIGAPVVDVAECSSGRQPPKPVLIGCAGTGQQLPVAYDGNQLRRRRRKHVETAVRLKDSAPGCTAESCVIYSQPGEGRTARCAPAKFQGTCDIHITMLARSATC